MPWYSDKTSSYPEARKRGDRDKDRGGGKNRERDREPHGQERGREKNQDRDTKPRDTSTDPKKPKKPPRKPRPPPPPKPDPPKPDPPKPPQSQNSSDYTTVPGAIEDPSSSIENDISCGSQNYIPVLSEQPRGDQKESQIKGIRISGASVKAYFDYTVQDSFVSEKFGKCLKIESKRADGHEYKDPSGKRYQAKKRIKTSVEWEGRKLKDQRLYIVSGELPTKVVLGKGITSQIQETPTPISPAASTSELYSGQLSAPSPLPVRTLLSGGYTQDSQPYSQPLSNPPFSQSSQGSTEPQNQLASSDSTDHAQAQNAVQSEYTLSRASQLNSNPPFTSDYSGRSTGEGYRPRTAESGSAEGAGESYRSSYPSGYYSGPTGAPVPYSSSYSSPPDVNDEEDAQTPPYRASPFISSAPPPWQYHQF